MQKDFDSPFDITVDLYKQLVGVVKTPPPKKIGSFTENPYICRHN